jgi:hypothetical protein
MAEKTATKITNKKRHRTPRTLFIDPPPINAFRAVKQTATIIYASRRKVSKGIFKNEHIKTFKRIQQLKAEGSGEWRAAWESNRFQEVSSFVKRLQLRLTFPRRHPVSEDQYASERVQFGTSEQLY